MTLFAGKDLFTSDKAPIKLLSPISTSPIITEFAPINTLFPIRGAFPSFAAIVTFCEILQLQPIMAWA